MIDATPSHSARAGHCRDTVAGFKGQVASQAAQDANIMPEAGITWSQPLSLNRTFFAPMPSANVKVNCFAKEHRKSTGRCELQHARQLRKSEEALCDYIT